MQQDIKQQQENTRDTVQSVAAEIDTSKCRIRWSIAGIAECLVANLMCPCKLSYGNARFCRHPLADQIAASSMPQRDY